jgi:acyl carrier protein
LLAEQVRALALRSLGLDAHTVVEDARPLKDLGLDSLMAVELRNALARSLEIALPATMVFDYPSVTALAGYLLVRLDGSGGRPVAAPSLPDDATSLHALSEDAAEALLLAELDSPGVGVGGGNLS